MPVQTQCPHCKTPCLVSEQYFGTPVACRQCGRSFVVPPAAVPVAPPPAVPVAPPPPVVSIPRPGRLDIGSATSPGRVRERNEDCLLVQHLTWTHLDQCHELALLAVVDGMGGHEAGDQASRLAICMLGSALSPLLAAGLNLSLPDAGGPPMAEVIEPEQLGLLTTVRSLLRKSTAPRPQERPAIDTSPAALGAALQDALLLANRTVYQKAQEIPACKGMGATAAVLLIWDGLVHIGHVGDCRVYHQRGQQLTQVTKDQTLVARMLELGQISPRDAASHPARNEVTQAVGRRPTLEPGRHELQLVRGDWLVVACDGLHTHVEPPMIQEAISKATAAASLAGQMVDLANQFGGSDNCTVIAVRYY